MPNGAPGAAGGNPDKDKSTGTRTRTQSVSLETPEPVVIDYILEAIKAEKGYSEWALTNDNATELDELASQEFGDPWDGYFEEMAEHYDYLSVDDWFGGVISDKGIEYIGTESLFSVDYLLEGNDEADRAEADWETLIGLPDPDGRYAPEGEPVISEEDAGEYQPEDIYPYGDEDRGLKAYIPAPDMLEVLHGEGHNSNIQSQINTILARDFFDQVMDWALENINALDQPVRLKASKAKRKNHLIEEDGNERVDEVARMQYVGFSVEVSEDTGKAILNAHGASDEIVDGWDETDLADKTIENFRQVMQEVNGE